MFAMSPLWHGDTVHYLVRLVITLIYPSQLYERCCTVRPCVFLCVTDVLKVRKQQSVDIAPTDGPE